MRNAKRVDAPCTRFGLRFGGLARRIQEERERDDTMDGQTSLPDDPVDFNDDLDDNLGEDGDVSD